MCEDTETVCSCNKLNEYDNESFFQEYAKMTRSRERLSAAGEWSQLKRLFPPLQGKTVLDLGCGIEEYEYPPDMWDCVVSNLALHYIENIEKIFQEVHRTLRAGGVFIFNIEHPVFTAGVGQDWIYTEDGTPQYWPIDNYFTPGARSTRFLRCDVVKQHHTLTQILMGLLENGFELEAVIEAEPPREMMDIPGMKDEVRRPMMLLVKANKK